jgi:hypothetical protein
MSTAINPREARWFALCVGFFLLVLFPAFVQWAPWTFSIPTERAAEEYPGQVDPNWRAVHVNHGRPSEWPYGTIRQNPLGYAGCSAALAFGLTGYLYTLKRAKQAQAEACRGISG